MSSSTFIPRFGALLGSCTLIQAGTVSSDARLARFIDASDPKRPDRVVKPIFKAPADAMGREWACNDVKLHSEADCALLHPSSLQQRYRHGARMVRLLHELETFADSQIGLLQVLAAGAMFTRIPALAFMSFFLSVMSIINQSGIQNDSAQSPWTSLMWVPLVAPPHATTRKRCRC